MKTGTVLSNVRKRVWPRKNSLVIVNHFKTTIIHDVNEKLSKNVKSGSFFIMYLIWSTRINCSWKSQKLLLVTRTIFSQLEHFFQPEQFLKQFWGTAGTMKVHLFLILSVWSCAKRSRVDDQMRGSPRFLPGMNQNRFNPHMVVSITTINPHHQMPNQRPQRQRPPPPFPMNRPPQPEREPQSSHPT